MIDQNESFDWTKYESYKGGNRLIQNPSIKGQGINNICYSHEPYAQELFDLINGNDRKIIRKDLTIGEVVNIVDIFPGTGTNVVVEIEGGLNVDVDLAREKKFAQRFGYTDIVEFAQILSHPLHKKNVIKDGLGAYVLDIDPIKISLWEGYVLKTREEFLKEIDNPSKAYVAVVKEANKGGYFVEVQGVDAFMPGSLAAANKIHDFRTLLGKEVVVMVEDYIKEMKSFIVSHKKYINHVLPDRIKELNPETRYTGNITGTSKYGIFLEFGDIFTGLLHVSKMKSFTLDEFRARRFQPGDSIGFYINEVTKDNRIILTEESPVERKSKIDTFLENNKDKTIEARVAAIMNFGVIVNYGEVSGLVPNKEFRKKKMFPENLTSGDTLSVIFQELNDDKIIFKLPKFQSN